MCKHGRKSSQCFECYRDAFHARTQQFAGACRLLRSLRALEIRPLGAAPLEIETSEKVIPLRDFQIWRTASGDDS
jgi:hypothetical protein